MRIVDACFSCHVFTVCNYTLGSGARTLSKHLASFFFFFFFFFGGGGGGGEGGQAIDHKQWLPPPPPPRALSPQSVPAPLALGCHYIHV